MKYTLRTILRRTLAFFLLAVSVISFLIVIAIAVKGGRCEIMGLEAGNPAPRMALGVLCLLGWAALHIGFAGKHDTWVYLLKRIPLPCLSIGITLGATEFALRAYLRQTQGLNTLAHLKQMHENGLPIRARSSHPLAAITRLTPNKKLIYELIPNLQMDFGGSPLTHNAAGMREKKDYPVERLPSSVRIVGIGDSGMFGWNVLHHENYMSVLEDRLNARSDGVLYEVLNMGVPGYNTQQEVDSLIAKGLAYKPDIVIVGWCENDFALPGFVAPQKHYNEKDVSYLYALVFDRAGYQRMVLPDVQDRRGVNYDLIDPEVLEGEGVEGVRRSLEKLVALGHAHAFKPLVFGPIEDSVLRVCADVGIEIINTFKEIPEGTYPDEFGIYHPHPNPQGHAALGQLLEQSLRARGWL